MCCLGKPKEESILKRKDKYHKMLLICGILKNDTSELIYKMETDSQT